MPIKDPKDGNETADHKPSSSLSVEERLKRLDRDVRNLYIALERNTAAMEALYAETRKLGLWLDSTARSTQEIAQSRIWRTLAWIGGLLLATPLFRRDAPAAVLPAESEDPESDYQRWMREFEWRDAETIRLRLARFTNRPRISIITPCFGVAAHSLQRTLDSVFAQSCAEWELCIAGDSSQKALPHDPRIRTKLLTESSGEAAVWSAALELASGDYVVWLEPGGMLAEDALYYILELLNREPATDIIYADHDSMDESGRRSRPFFKPDWSPDLLRSTHYVGSLVIFRRADGIQCFARDAGGSLDYDLMLRLVERTSRIRHIPRILYHEADARPKRDPESDRRAVEGHLRRTHSGGWAEPDPEGGNWRVRYPIPADAHVSIIIPAGGKVDLLEACLDQLATKTDYPHYEIVLIDNSKDEAVARFTRDWRLGSRTARYIDWRGKPFNFSAICNAAARECDSPFLLFLNDDTSVITRDWLTAMVELGARPEVGAVGARLLFPNGQIQHAGITLGLYGRCGHLFKGLDSSRPQYFGLDRMIRNVSAVTGACLLVRAGVFHEVGGFDEDYFPVDANDPDLCLRIAAKGYRVLYTPYAQVYHYESMSKRGFDHHTHPPEYQAFCQRWAEAIRNDPFYNPNLTRMNVDCSLRRKGE